MTATSATLTSARLLPLVDRRDFRKLFIEELGWDNPDQPDRTVAFENSTYTLTQVAGYKGMRIWHCSELPGRRIQRALDQALEKDNFERLVIFTSDTEQEWRWPRRAQTGGVNAKLLVHAHKVGEDDTHLIDQLDAITIDFDEDPTLVEVLARMRSAFDVEAEAASVAAARLMARLYTELEASELSTHDATLLLARLLFLLFGDDSGMWRTNMFRDWLATYTTDTTLHTDLIDLFDVLNKDEKLRGLPPGSPLAEFRYVNGGLYRDQLHLSELSAGFRAGLLDACDFDWSLISPAVFGSMFQVVKDKEARREGGEHYTTEENILKTINPLFLDEYRDRLDQAWDDKGQLTRLHNDLGRLRIMDPACGCGNFLIVAYRELRAIELEILKRRRQLDEADLNWSRSQMTLDVTGDIKVTLDHFYGIEIEEWPARIAEVAMLLVDHLANQAMQEEFGNPPDRLPIKIAPTIVHDNALHLDWRHIVPPSDDTIVVGNPPFIGQYTKTAQQTADTKAIWGPRYNGYLDYVTCWYAKAIDHYGSHKGRWAFVSTNSICQGEAVEFLWRPILEAGWRCRFAHRSFRWVTEAKGGAAVHVSIIGFDKATTPRPTLWTYPWGGVGKGTPHVASKINPYLVADAPILLVSSRTRPISPSMPAVGYGNKPTDGGHFFVSATDLPIVQADPTASKYLRRFVGAKELLHDKDRWCLWLVGATQEEINSSPVLRSRVAAVRAMRQASSKAATRKKAATPHLFDERRQPDTSYLAIPAHVGEHRRYFTAARYDSEVINGNANFMVADPDGFVLGVLSSSMFIAWMRAIGGRIKSDLRFSNTFTYNTFPLPPLSDRQRGAVVAAAQGIVDARSQHLSASLADLYAPDGIPADLLEAHAELDRVMDRIFDLKPGATEDDRQKHLFRRYAKLTGQEVLDI
ncbi:class I SAM-dependent DNA methyltransferase [Georgenia satyanarayanai]|uniref:class I SAM-dependent DNA methyltransferase n=1 Tax=Georgenia satyanarayanai TaxID=860221 RepID=UPI0012658935|nr:DNA methyltransferase [Georgenia satyanarayanai]